MMDEEWLVEGEQHLVWWPTPLPLVVEAEAGDVFPDSNENWIRLTASTIIGSAEESLGRSLASEFTASYPVGALVYREGELSLRTSYAFNPRNRSLLSWFRECVLIQSAVAVQLADEWQSIEGLDLFTHPHPTSGYREDVDELVRIYHGEVLGMSVDDGVVPRFEAMRPNLREAMFAKGFSLGFSNEEVDFFNLGFDNLDSDALPRGAFDIGVGFMPGTARDQRFGPSLTLLARILPPGVNFTAHEASLANENLSRLPWLSQFGSISGPEGGSSGGQLHSMIPYLTLAGWSHGPGLMLTSVTNAITHVIAAAQRFRVDSLETP